MSLCSEEKTIRFEFSSIQTRMTLIKPSNLRTKIKEQKEAKFILVISRYLKGCIMLLDFYKTSILVHIFVNQKNPDNCFDKKVRK